jgi:hypothetical protein
MIKINGRVEVRKLLPQKGESLKENENNGQRTRIEGFSRKKEKIYLWSNSFLNCCPL